MKPLQAIDFIDQRQIQPLGVACLVLAALGVAWQGYATFQERTLMQREKEGMASLFRKNTKPAAAAMTPADVHRHAQIDALARYVATPWDEWLSVLEDHLGDKAVLRRFEQDATSGALKITARARSMEAMMMYFMALEQDPRVREVRLLNHELLRTEPGAPVQFELTAVSHSTMATPLRSVTAAKRPTEKAANDLGIERTQP